MADLDPFRILGRGAQGHGNIIGNLIPGDGNDRRVLDGAIGKDRQVRSTPANIDETDAQLLLVFPQHRITRTELFQHQIIHLQAAAADALDDVLCGANSTRNEMHPRLQADTAHADGLADTLLAVDDEFLGQNMEDPLVRGNRDRPGGVDDPIHVGLTHLPILDGGDAVGTQATDMAAGDARVDRVDLAAGHQLRLFDGALYGLNRGLDIHHHAALEAPGGMGADPHDLDQAILPFLAHQAGDLGGANIQPH